MPLLLSVLLALGVAGPVPPATPEARGDLAWRDRADGFLASGVVKPGPVEVAIEAYEEALAGAPDDMRIRFKLMEALYFKGYFVVREKKIQKQIYARLVDLARDNVAAAALRAGAVEPSGGLSPEARAKILADVPEAKRAHFWAAISWGLWGMSHSWVASGAKGVAGKIRDHARIVVLLDESFADAGGLRLLGRLHTATPKIPLFTGWIDRDEGLELLRRANRISTRDPRNPLFLAEAILEHDPANSPTALDLLRDVASRQPDPDYLVEQTETIERARELLDEIK